MSRPARTAEAVELRPFEASLPMALLQAREAAMRLFRPLLAEHDLTEQQWRVLRALRAADDPVDAGELAERTFLLAPSLSRMLSNMESSARGRSDDLGRLVHKTHRRTSRRPVPIRRWTARTLRARI